MERGSWREETTPSYAHIPSMPCWFCVMVGALCLGTGLHLLCCGEESSSPGSGIWVSILQYKTCMVGKFNMVFSYHTLSYLVLFIMNSVIISILLPPAKDPKSLLMFLWFSVLSLGFLSIFFHPSQFALEYLIALNFNFFLFTSWCILIVFLTAVHYFVLN